MISVSLKNLTPVVIAAVLASSGGAVLGQDWEGDYYGGGGSQRGLFGGGSNSSFAYDYLDLGYFSYQFDDPDVAEASGFAADFSIPLISTLYARAALGYATPSTSEGEDLDYITWKLGGGIGIPINSKLDFVIEGGLAREKFVSDVLDNPIDGYGLYVAPSLRLMLGDLFEVNGGVTITNIDSNTDLGVDLKALMHLTPTLSVFGSANYSDEVSQYGLGLRLSF